MVADKKHERFKMLNTAAHEAFVNNTMKAVSDMSAVLLAKKIEEEFQLTASVTTVARFRRQLGWKQRLTRYCQLIRDANKEKRVVWCQQQLENQETFDVGIFLL